MSIYSPYTYLIGWIKHNKYYYGVRYAKNCNPSDLWNTYYTSSEIVKNFAKVNGDPDIIQIRKIFDNSIDAINWESKVLKRFNCAKSEMFLNKHNNTSFVPLSGEENPSKRLDVRLKLSNSTKNREITDEIKNGRLKMSETKIKKSIVKFVKEKNFKPQNNKVLIHRIEKYIRYIEDNYPNHIRIHAILKQRLNGCVNYIRKPYPKNRKRTPRGKMPNISNAKRGKNWYHDPETFVTRPFNPGEQPDGWVKGMIKKTPNNNTEEVKAKLSKKMKRLREEESQEKREKRLQKYHETIQNRYR